MKHSAFEQFLWWPWLTFAGVMLACYWIDQRLPLKTWVLWCVGIATAMVVFWLMPTPGPNLVLFSNDGPLGVMNSAYMRDSAFGGPGTATWNDLNFLGEPGGESTAYVSYTILWLLSGAQGERWKLAAVAGAMALGALIGLIVRRRNARPTQYCSTCGDVAIKATMLDQIDGTRICQKCWRAMLWGPRFEGFRTKKL